MDNYNIQQALERNNKKWDITNTSTIIDWIAASNLNVFLLDTYLLHLKRILRTNTLWSLIISSVTSTVSITQFTLDESSNASLALLIKIIIFTSSIFTSLITGYIKVEKIQEKLEQIEESKKTWETFLISLTSQLQIGINFRINAETIINDKKKDFNMLQTKTQDIPEKVRYTISKLLLNKEYLKAQEEFEPFISNDNICKQTCRIVCCRKNKHIRRFIKMTRKKLRFYNTINRLLRKELLTLIQVYPHIINEIKIFRVSDLFGYDIITNNKTLKIHKKAQKEGNIMDHYVSINISEKDKQKMQEILLSKCVKNVKLDSNNDFSDISGNSGVYNDISGNINTDVSGNTNIDISGNTNIDVSNNNI